MGLIVRLLSKDYRRIFSHRPKPRRARREKLFLPNEKIENDKYRIQFQFTWLSTMPRLIWHNLILSPVNLGTHKPGRHSLSIQAKQNENFWSFEFWYGRRERKKILSLSLSPSLLSHYSLYSHLSISFPLFLLSSHLPRLIDAQHILESTAHLY